MRVYLLKRLLNIVPTVLMITFVVFVMMRSVPGDPVVALLGDAYNEDGAVRQNSWPDYAATTVAMIGVSIPEFFAGILLLLVFSFGLGGLLPSSGWIYLPGTCPSIVCGVSFWGNATHVLMPAVALGIGR